MTPLFIKTQYSLLSSMIRIQELVEYSKGRYTSLTITDSNLYGAMEFYLACKSNQINPIIGLEITINQKKIVLYARNEKGYHHLLKLSTKQSEGTITLEDCNQNQENLILILPFESNSLKEELNYPYWYQGYRNKEEREQLQGDNRIFFEEVLYFEEKDAPYLPYLYGIRDGLLLEQVTIDSNSHALSIYQEEMEDFKNNLEIEKLCQLEIKKREDLLPIYDCPNGLSSYDYLKQLCKEGLQRIFGTTVKKIYIDRLKQELEVIRNMGFCNYFLVVYDYVHYAKTHDVFVGPGRGSAAGSLVSYLLDITTIDPISYHLFFERFLNKDRVTMPDIDVDFEYDKREQVLDYCVKKYGEKKVVPIITYGTLASKQAVRDVARVMGVEQGLIERFCKKIDSKLSLKENLQKNKELEEMISANVSLKKMFQIAMKFEGLKRHTSIHAAGVVMSHVDLDEVIPLDKTHDFYKTGFSMEYLEGLGLLKMDFLAIKNLSFLHHCMDDLNLKLEDIPLHDPKTLELFTNADTIGVFQFESAGMINFLTKFKPTTFEDLIAAIALFRPGPMDNIDLYIKRRKGEEQVEYLDPSLENILKPTYGIIIYQEQIMQIASVIAGYSYAEADILRRAMSKKKESVLLEQKEEFITRSIQLGKKREVATKIYDLILKFANYGFNRAHAVSYAMFAYQMAYIKAHYPSVFMKHLLTMSVGSSEKTKDYIYQCKLHHISILTPSINDSTDSYIVHQNGLLFPLVNIKNVGANGCKAILKEREKEPFHSVFDFVKRCYGGAITRRTLESLICAGCFFDYNRRTLMENLDLILNYAEIGGLLDSEELLPVLEEYPEYSKKELMNLELDLFGFYLSDHPVTEYKVKYRTPDLQDLPKYFDKFVTLVAFVEHKREVQTKNGSIMAFLTGSDERSTIDIVLFPKVYQSTNIEETDIVLVEGKVEKRFSKYQLVVSSIKKIDD